MKTEHRASAMPLAVVNPSRLAAATIRVCYRALQWGVLMGQT